VQSAVKNVEKWLAKEENSRWRMPTEAETPIRATYRPELDVSLELTPVYSAYYQSLIGLLRWIVDFGRVDVCLDVSMLSSHLALPREGQLVEALQIFSYLRKYHNTELVFDPTEPNVNSADFEQPDWSSTEFGHVERKEELPPNAPEPRGLGFRIIAKVDADHADDTVTRRSRIGFLVFLNGALIYWFSKKQNSVNPHRLGLSSLL
jgi:hypothetical protein